VQKFITEVRLHIAKCNDLTCVRVKVILHLPEPTWENTIYTASLATGLQNKVAASQIADGLICAHCSTIQGMVK
jgi:hypothetical protein